jgi:hypothetical protein
MEKGQVEFDGVFADVQETELYEKFKELDSVSSTFLLIVEQKSSQR